MISLKVGSTLQSGKYEIIKILGQGGFGITYLVRHSLLDTLFCIKEFFPQDYCNRDSTTSRVQVATQSNVDLVSRLKTRFVSEARNLIKLKHPGIVAIHDIFEENDTAYFVMDYIDGRSLDDMVTQTGPIQEKKAVAYMKKVAEAVAFIHGHNITHFDIKPANVMVRASDGEPVLIDFGLSKQFNEQGHARSTLLMGVSHGFSPLEQYMQDGIDSFSPRSDIYSLGATLYFLVTGRVPPEALKLAAATIEVPETVGPTTSQTIKWAMQSLPENRCPSADDFVRALDSKETPTKLAEPYAAVPKPVVSSPLETQDVRIPEPVKGKSSNNRMIVLFVLVALVVISIVIAFLLKTLESSEVTEPSDTYVSTSSGEAAVEEEVVTTETVAEPEYDYTNNGRTIIDYLAAYAIETSVNGHPAWYYQGYFSDGKRDYAVKLKFVKTGVGTLEAQYKNVEYNVAPMSMTVSDVSDSEMTLYNEKNKFKIILYKGSNGDLYGRALQGKNDLSVRLSPTSYGF